MVAVINNRLGVAIAVSGAYKMVMDLRMAEAYGLTIRREVNGDCGHYYIPGSGVEHDYAGVVESPFVMQLGERVAFTLTGMCVIEHPFALFLMGADVMCGGREGPTWNYEGLTIRTEKGRVTGSVHFRNGDVTESILLV